ncbi:MAG: MCP four helix bundle domain-containing protein [Chitinivibrionales bacterium]|nr:MCP four helix bundle domain-containing protein [Chitinivibrionales bacterium]
MNRPKPMHHVYTVLDCLFSNSTWWGLAAALVVSLISSISSIMYVAGLSSSLQTMYERDLLGQNYVQSARIRLLSMDKEARNLFLMGADGHRQTIIDKISTARLDVAQLLKQSGPMYPGRRSAPLHRETDAAFSACTTTIGSLVDLSLHGQSDRGLRVLRGELSDRFGHLDSLLDSLDNIKQRRDIRVLKNIHFQLTASIIFTLITFAFAIGLKFFLYRRKAAV